MPPKTRTVHTTSKRTGYVVACCPDENIKLVRFDDRQVGKYALVGEAGGRTGTIFDTKAEAKNAADGAFKNHPETGWWTVLAVGPLERNRIKTH